ncbi:methionine aminopeptidase, putative [Theileria equi strain WA]|uniref:Methionine aminopeptidase 2 n=1 Tax=Theileria equi strain WA TaxID=1537102 RepID=L1LD97_THEEQ|nr:methionine aminopeptidase, putative [Theileria equi strain WA]EKX73412.1 methionine aminopeptidase, putative [Theileria equi strain WA]|eukprot:XP_004832864.1 methionine aminopeptidase, putative [Theileria equi strain WA]
MTGKPDQDDLILEEFMQANAQGTKKKSKSKKKAVEEDDDALLQLESVVLKPTNPLLDNPTDPEPIRLVGEWKEPVDWSKSVVSQFKGKKYPEGEVCEYYGSGASRVSAEEKRHLEKISSDRYNDMRKAAEVHRQVRRYIQSVIKPGVRCLDLVNAVETKTKELIEADGLKAGWGFPTGCSLNDCAAHYTPNYGDETILRKGDICKLDFGTHVNGYIIDSAFTIAFDEQYDELIKATQEGTNVGVKLAGIDARVAEIGEAIQEAIESHEVVINGRTYPVKAIRNLTGHSIGAYHIHSGKSVPIVANSGCNDIMEEGDVFAIETFASTGQGYVWEKMECSHYMKDFYANFAPLRLKSARELLKVINTNFGTLPFCKRWLDDLTNSKGTVMLKNLVEAGIVVPYPPLCDVKDSFTSQMEHTILLRPTCKEVLSRGDDY